MTLTTATSKRLAIILTEVLFARAILDGVVMVYSVQVSSKEQIANVQLKSCQHDFA